MDIEAYLRQKRGLERKKEILEAKAKLKENKETVKKETLRGESETRHSERPERSSYEHRDEPSLKPWMIWDLIILTVVIILF